MDSEVPINTVQRVYELLDERGMNLGQLSRICGVSTSTVRRAGNRRTQLAVETIFRICKGLGISMSEFFREPSEASDIHRAEPGEGVPGSDLTAVSGIQSRSITS